MSARSGQLVIVKLFELLNSFQANRTAKAIEKSWWPEKVQRCSSFSTFFLACKYSLCKSAAKHHGDQLELLPYFTFCRGFPQKESRTQSSFCRGFPPKSRTQSSFCRGFPPKSRTQFSFCRGFPSKSRTQLPHSKFNFVQDFHFPMRSMHIRSDASGRDQLVATEAKKEKCSARKIFAKLFLTEHFFSWQNNFLPKNQKN